LKELSKQVDGPSRVRKSDIEQLRRRLEKLVEQRDQAASEPRREEIPTKIRRLEEKVDSIKRIIDDDRIVLESLRSNADEEHRVSMLREQCTKETERLEDTIRENTFTFQKFNLQAPEGLPSYNDNNDQELFAFVQGIRDKVQAEYDKAKTAHSNAEDVFQRAQRLLSERSAVVATKNQSLQLSKSRLEVLSAPGGGVAKVDNVIENLRKYEAPLGLQSPKRGSNPREVLAYLENRLEEIDADAPLVNEEYSRKLLKKLKRMGKMKLKDGNTEYNCPCCLRDMNKQVYDEFVNAMDAWMQDPNATFANKQKEAEYIENKAKYDDWKKVVYESSDDVREHQRLQKECALAEAALQELRDGISSNQDSLSKQKKELTERRDEMDELREFFDSSKRWAEDAHNINEKRVQMGQANDQLGLGTAVAGRDLRSVENELTERAAKKEEHVDEINKLNKEMSELNNRMAMLATQVCLRGVCTAGFESSCLPNFAIADFQHGGFTS
jgi:DNA repair exonuclease SbcCD ATPase subunit